MEISLPTEPIDAKRENPRFMLIYGPRKVGKTSQLIRLPNNLIIDTESGTDYVKGLKYVIPGYLENQDPMARLEHFKKVCDKINNTNPRQYRYVTIDVIDELENWAIVLAGHNYKATNAGKNWDLKQSVETMTGSGSAVGPGYRWIREAFREILQLTYALAETVIYVGHVRDKSMEAVGTTADSKELDLIGKNKAIMCSICDTVGHMYRTSMGGIGINFKSHQHVLCSSRVTHVTGMDFQWEPGQNIDWSKIFKPESPT